MSELFTDTKLNSVAFLPFVTQFYLLREIQGSVLATKKYGEYGEERGLNYGTKPPPPLFTEDYNSKIALF